MILPTELLLTKQTQPDTKACLVKPTQPDAKVCRVNMVSSLQALLGDKASRRSLRQAIHHFVALRRYEQMSVHQAVQGIKLASVTALRPSVPYSMFPHLLTSPKLVHTSLMLADICP